VTGQGLAVKAAAGLLALAVALVLLVVVVLDPASSSSASGCTAVSSASSRTPPPAATGGGLAGLDAEAQANARILAAVVVGRHLPARALVILDSAGLAESGLHSDDYGDAAGPDSRGILQQRDSWGPLAVRMDPAGAAGLFLDRLVNVADWQTVEPWVAAQDVQASAYDGHPRAVNNYSSVVGGNYLAKTPQAIALTQQLYGDPGLTLICGGGPSGSGGPVPVAIGTLPAAPAPYSGPAGGGPCDVPDAGGCIREATAHLRAAVLAAFPTMVRSAGCYSDRPGDHGTGVACDFMITTGPAAAGQDLVNGWTVAAWVRANAAALDVAYVIWYLRIWDARHPQPDDNGGWGQPYAGCSYCPSIIGDPSAAHTNHVHVSIQSPVTE
jgi:hypothetical protein